MRDACGLRAPCANGEEEEDQAVWLCVCLVRPLQEGYGRVTAMLGQEGEDVDGLWGCTICLFPRVCVCVWCCVWLVSPCVLFLCAQSAEQDVLSRHSNGGRGRQ